MSDDGADPELLELLRQSLQTPCTRAGGISTNTGVLEDAEYIYNNSIDVSIDMYGTKSAAAAVYPQMKERGYSTQSWNEHPLHPRLSDNFSEVDMVNFIFALDLLNFSFWSALGPEDRFQVEYQTKRWTGYNSLAAALRRALNEGVPITNPAFWISEACTDRVIRQVFRSATSEEMPLLKERITMLREAGNILHESFGAALGNEDGEDRKPVEAMKMNKASTISTEEGLVSQQILHEGAGAKLSTKIEELVLRTQAVDLDSNRSTAGNNETLVGADESTSAESTAEFEHLRNAVEDVTADEETVTARQYDSVSMVADTEPLTQPAGTIVDTISTTGTSSTAPINTPQPDMSVVRLLERAHRSAGKLVNLLIQHFPHCFDDTARFEHRKVRLLKRAQILVADLWAAYNNKTYGHFTDIDHLTMFADYRVPQMLHSLGVISYSPSLSAAVRSGRVLESGGSWEVQLRGCSIWAVEMMRREILKIDPQAKVNAVLIDFFLYDLAKEREAAGVEVIPHHRTRSIWY